MTPTRSEELERSKVTGLLRSSASCSQQPRNVDESSVTGLEPSCVVIATVLFTVALAAACQPYTGRWRVAGEVGGFWSASLPLCLPGNEALSLLTRILSKHSHNLWDLQHLQEGRCQGFLQPSLSRSRALSTYRVALSACGSSALRFPVLPPPPPPPPPSSRFPRSDLNEEDRRSTICPDVSTSTSSLQMRGHMMAGRSLTPPAR